MIFDEDIQLTLKPVKDYAGLPRTIHSVILDGLNCTVEIVEGPKGDIGPEGEPSWPWHWQGDAPTVAFLNALQASLGPDEFGYAWRVVEDDRIRYWAGEQWYSLYGAFKKPGHRGASNVLTATATTGAVGSSAAATLTGTSPGQVLNLTVPQGVTGDVGDPGSAGAILKSSDVNITDPYQDMVLSWDTATSKWVPGAPPHSRGPWAIGSSSFNVGSNINTIPKTLATITIPAQGYAWRPIIEGGVSLQCHVRTLGASRVDVEIRLDATDGEIVGYGTGFSTANWYYVRFYPKFAYPVSPGSSVGVVPAKKTTRLYVVTARPVGSNNYSINADAAQLIVYATPA